MKDLLPDFFVLGAQKAGTTSLHDRLLLHPDICLPRLKETQFFAFEEKFCLGPDWYLGQFPDCRKKRIIGEVCPDYMFFPESARRIRSLIECPKLIFIFRHPLRRAYSHYLMTVRQGFESLEFGKALEAEKSRITENLRSFGCYSYLSRGFYSEQVDRFQSEFPNSRFLFLKFEDLTDCGATGQYTFSKICDFLDIASINIDPGIHSNAASEPRSTWLRDWLYGSNYVKKTLGTMLPRPMKEQIAITLDRWNQSPIRYDNFGKIPLRFVQVARDETRKLQSLTGLDLSEWVKDLSNGVWAT